MSRWFLKSIFRSVQGVSLVETMIALSVLAGAGVMTMQMRDMSSNKNHNDKKNVIATALINEIKYNLRLKNICENSLRGVSVGDVDINIPGRKRYRATEVYDNDLTLNAAATTGVRIDRLAIPAGGIDREKNSVKIEVIVSKLNQKTGGNLGGNIADVIEIKAEIGAGNTIQNCLDSHEMYQRSMARMLCGHLCPSPANAGDTTEDGDCSLQGFTVNNTEGADLANPHTVVNGINPRNTESTYERCRMAVYETLKEAERELCLEMGATWDPDADDSNGLKGQCNKIFSDFANGCTGNTYLKGAYTVSTTTNGTESATTETGAANAAANIAKEYSWNCVPAATYVAGSRTIASENCDPANDGDWSAWSQVASNVCSGENFTQTRTCRDNSSVVDTNNSVGTNPAACGCAANNACPDSRFVFDDTSPCNGKVPGESVACSVSSCDPLICQAQSCVDNVAFSSESQCQEAFVDSVTCVDTTPDPGEDLETQTVELCPKGQDYCYAGRNKLKAVNGVDLKQAFPRLNTEEPIRVEAQFSGAFYTDRRPHALLKRPNDIHTHVLSKTKTTSNVTKGGDKKAYTIFSIDYSSFIAAFSGNTSGWGDCGSNACGGALEDARITVAFRRPAGEPQWNCVDPNNTGIDCSDICNAYTCVDSSTVTLEDWMLLCNSCENETYDPDTGFVRMRELCTDRQ